MRTTTSSVFALLQILFLTALCMLPLSSNATLLGRLNAYYNANQLPTDVDTLKLQKASLDTRIKEIDSKVSKDLLSSNDYSLYSKLMYQRAKVDALLQLYSDQKTKFDAWYQAEAASTKAAMAADAEGADESTKQKAKEAKDAAVKKHAEFDTVQNALFQKKNTVVDETSNGIAEGAASTATLINSNSGGANTSLALRAYQYNLIFWKKSAAYSTSEPGEQTDKVDLTKYSYIPMYIFLKKPVDSIVNKVTLYGDLLDNEHGGTLNIKLSNGFKRFHKFFSENDENFKGYGFKFIVDSGIKVIEAPALQPAPPNTTTTSNWIGAGYIGVGANLELPITESLQSSTGTPGATPAGGMALGIGIYRNHVNATQFDNTPFPGRVPNYYNTWALMYEMQITELLSIKATRMVPKDKNALGTYSAFQVSYKF